MTFEQIKPQQNNQQEDFNTAEQEILKIVEEIQKSNGIINGLNGFIEGGTDQEKILGWRKAISDEDQRINVLKEEKIKLQKYNQFIQENNGDELLAATKMDAAAHKKEHGDYKRSSSDELLEATTEDAVAYRKKITEGENGYDNVVNIFDREGGLARIKKQEENSTDPNRFDLKQ